MTDDSTQRRRNRMLASLEGLSVGDAFGMSLVWCVERIPRRQPPDAEWRWTDDTEMALSVASVLNSIGEIDGDLLALSFAERFSPSRMYGPAMLHELLPRLQRGADWRHAAPALFRGSGSYGNGAAMRVAPLGAYFSGDLDVVAEQARRSAEVTHAHREGIAGAIAVAVAAALACDESPSQGITGPRTFLEAVIPHVPEGEVRAGLCRAIGELGPNAPVAYVAELLGNGALVSAQDTVPFCLWIAGRYRDDYEEAMWQCVSALGDMDTNCAIVGGIIGARVGVDGIPVEWRRSREPLPRWHLSDTGSVT